jgi:hypothetical protein
MPWTNLPCSVSTSMFPHPCQPCLMFIGLCFVQLTRGLDRLWANAAPDIQAIEQKAAISHKALTCVQTLPKGVVVLDTLGLR